MSHWKSAVEQEWNRRAQNFRGESAAFPLISQSFDSREIVAVVDTLLSGQLTMANRVREFEKIFASYVGAKYAVMVNSGSSANLLALAVATNPARSHYLKPGDEVLVPAVCWSTSIWPIVQMGLKPVFVDTDPETLNISLSDLKTKISPRTRAVVAVHILGNSCPMPEFLDNLKQHRLMLIEDTCESLGSKSQGRYLGTFGEFGAYSFYYSHHITTGEGGMIVCDSLEDYDLLKCLRAHGWSRELSNRRDVEERNPEIDPRFLFVNMGFNLRPMEVQAAFGICQIERLAAMNRVRILNHQRLTDALENHGKWKRQFSFPKAAQGTEAVWFGFPVFLNGARSQERGRYLSYLTSRGIESRPIVSGNFIRQPALKRMGIECDPTLFPGAEKINHTGFFIGLHTEELPTSTLEMLADRLLDYEFQS